jgi:glycosyltransferase involved in cell wall biosynthesis
MNVTLLSIADGKWGGARAAYRLLQGLETLQTNTHMLVQSKFTADPQVIGPDQKLGRVMAKVRSTIDGLPLSQYPNRQTPDFSCQWLPDRLTAQIARLKPDILNLHWACAGYLQVETLARFPYPMVWTLHDMWAFTGGCHYSETCDSYTHTCGACPQLGSTDPQDLSHWVWQRKQRAWAQTNLTIVTPSHWLADCARRSSLFQHRRIEVIANGIDLSQYCPQEKSYVRQQLGLPLHKKLILFGAINAESDLRKGFQFLQPTLKTLSHMGWADQVELVVFGAKAPSQPPDLGFPCHYLGSLNTEPALAQVYAAADVFVAPSVQDNLPNTVLEALACGTPAVAFGVGGMPDLIEHQRQGYLAQPFDTADFAQGIAWVLADSIRLQHLGHAARLKAEQSFDGNQQAQRYHALFAELLAAQNQKNSDPGET